VILAFYPSDWSPVCSDQMALYQELLPEFQRFKRGAPGHLRGRYLVPSGLFSGSNLSFPLLADFEPKGEVARAYDVYRAADGTSERACT